MGTPLAAEDIDNIGPNILANVALGYREYGYRRYIRPGFKQCSRPQGSRSKDAVGASLVHAAQAVRRTGDVEPEHKQSIDYKEIKNRRRMEIEACIQLLELDIEVRKSLYKMINEADNLGWLERARAAITYVDLRDELLLRYSETAPRHLQQERELEASIEFAGETLLHQARGRRSMQKSEQRLQRLEHILKPHEARLVAERDKAARRETNVLFEQTSGATQSKQFGPQTPRSERHHTTLRSHTVLNSGAVKLKPTIEEVPEDMEVSEEPLLPASWPLPGRTTEEWTYMHPSEGWTRKVELDGDWQNPLESRWQNLERFEMAPDHEQARRFSWRNEDYDLLEPREQLLRDYEDIEGRRRDMQREICLRNAELERMRIETARLKAENGDPPDTPIAPSGPARKDTASPLPEGADAARDSIADDDEDEDLWESQSNASL
ncbi:hypothetical protein CERZMDRAFT_85159 [Cercospora zeae-maydis SCOH1-5]|uniref:Uncharacterized protein n=1 Tax=Cercospora zeae-maydis SCOH1-5 TaxID=717836 RepID=A0A6A6FED1_9PEZI|nr:hypothetical protein CERZMDRAFT_85159 [Cercospora zeae-maydis SCOH1-5]